MVKDRDELTRLEWVLMDALWTSKHATASELQKVLEPTQGVRVYRVAVSV